jgi:hypothetical protein
LGLPFCSADFILETATAHLKDAFEKDRISVLEDSTLVNDLSYLTSGTKTTLDGLFINGKWILDNASMYKILPVINIDDLLNLSKTMSIITNNPFVPAIISAYYISQLNDWILDYVKLNPYGTLNNFNIMEYVIKCEPNQKLINKLANILCGLMYFNNTAYVNFVNKEIKTFLTVMEANPYIYEPYIKGLDDKADYYAIGGLSLYEYSRNLNPYIRSYGWITNVFGNCEILESFYKWVSKIDNTSLLEILDTQHDQESILISALNNNASTLRTSKKNPNMLSNYTFSEKSYKFRNYVYHVDASLSTGSKILSILTKHIYPRSISTNFIPDKLLIRRVRYESGVLTVCKPDFNELKYDDGSVPFYIGTGGTEMPIPMYKVVSSNNIADIKLINIPGRHMLVYKLFNSRLSFNKTVIVFTKIRITKF